MATGFNGIGECNVSDWKDIVATSAGNSFSLGLKSDGTVVVLGNLTKIDIGIVSNWKSIKTVYIIEKTISK